MCTQLETHVQLEIKVKEAKRGGPENKCNESHQLYIDITLLALALYGQGTFVIYVFDRLLRYQLLTPAQEKNACITLFCYLLNSNVLLLLGT